MNRKVTVVGGAGNVGATVARAIADKELADVVIIDIAETEVGGQSRSTCSRPARSKGRIRASSATGQPRRAGSRRPIPTSW